MGKAKPQKALRKARKAKKAERKKALTKAKPQKAPSATPSRRTNLYEFVIHRNGAVEYLSASPVDADDQWALDHLIEKYYGKQGAEWEEGWRELVEYEEHHELRPDPPQAIKAWMWVNRTRHGDRVSYDHLDLHELAYTHDGSTWQEWPGANRPSEHPPVGPF
ncbi:hypothetical protein [Deinococcus pimensis]|uniref:hypothetical protein n=1 Tax=Deinococcus pimensis TaxID=309888 RepID=UPI00048347DE|nr:hypothetical protein [Deinococcus pimensis]